uniref:Uncharacterized protein n=1 Tax=Varanus komodoensis TaxID=61221 RepID=A0A8D2KXH3_VARKO
MPSEDPPPPSRPSRLAQEKPSKPGSPSSEGHRAKLDKMVQGGDAGRKPCRPASEGEKDSGFSDGSSECLSAVEQTDAEEQAGRSPRQPAKLPRPPQKGPGGLPGSALPGLAPIYIVKNVILKQVHPLDSGEGPPARLLLIQQPVGPLKGPLPGQKPPAKDACPPRLGGYPRIAPHPGHPPPAPQAGAAGPAPAAAASKGKRFCLDEAWSLASNATAPAGGGDKSRKEAPPAWGSPPVAAPPSLEALAQDAAASSEGWDLAEGRTLSRASKRLGCGSLGRQRRFQNTVEVLRRSGLLGITLRTKQLLRQNGSTQRELAELREHAQLLCEAVRSNDGRAWARLQQAVDRSAAYWAARGAGLDTQPPGQQSPPAAKPPDPRPGAGRASSPRSPRSAPLLPEAPVPAGLL